MKLYLGDFISPVTCEKILMEELQKLSPSKQTFCGLTLAEENKIYVAKDYKLIPQEDIFFHELSHVLLDELRQYSGEERKADMLAIRLKNILRQRGKINSFCRE